MKGINKVLVIAGIILVTIGFSVLVVCDIAHRYNNALMELHGALTELIQAQDQQIESLEKLLVILEETNTNMEKSIHDTWYRPVWRDDFNKTYPFDNSEYVYPENIWSLDNTELDHLDIYPYKYETAKADTVTFWDGGLK